MVQKGFIDDSAGAGDTRWDQHTRQVYWVHESIPVVDAAEVLAHLVKRFCHFVELGYVGSAARSAPAIISLSGNAPVVLDADSEFPAQRQGIWVGVLEGIQDGNVTT